MNFRKLEVFYEVAKELNMTKTSKKLFISQPAVSQMISELENELGVKLFNRIGKRLYLSSEGELFKGYSRRILNLYDEATSSIKDTVELKKGRLVIGASTTIGNYVLPRLVGDFIKLYPGVEFSIEIENTEKICELILQNKLDFAFVEAEVEEYEIESMKIWDDELVFISSPQDNLDIYGIPKKRFILREKGSGTRWEFEKTMLAKGINYEVFMELGNTEAIKKSVEAGMGVSCISKLAIKNEVEDGRLKSYSFDGLHIGRNFNLVYHRDKFFNKLMKTFVEYLEKTDV
jgi:DNA-binding transcriptional LysR family regulator